MAKNPEHQGQSLNTQPELVEWNRTFDVGYWHHPPILKKEISSTPSRSGTPPSLSIQSLAQLEVSKWYSNLRHTNRYSTQIDNLQVRSTTDSSKVTHRFVALYMCDGSVHRLDRTESTTDKLTRNVDPEELKKGTSLEIEITLGGHVDLWVVLSTCHAMSKDRHGQGHDSQRRNSFFSWTILMIASRYYLHIDNLLEEHLAERFVHKDHISVITKFIAGKGVQMFRDLVLESMATITQKAHDKSEDGENIRRGMSYLVRAVWGLPERVLGFGRKHLAARLAMRLQNPLEDRVKAGLLDEAPRLYHEVLANVNLELRKPLWVDDLEPLIRLEFKKTMTDMLWPSLIKSVMQGLGSYPEAHVLVEELHADIMQSYWRHIGTRSVQFLTVQAAALHGSLVNVRTEAQARLQQIRQDAKEETDNPDAELRKVNEKMFDLAWNNARDGSRMYAKEAVRQTRPSLRPEHQEVRDVMWNTLWKVWDDCWDKAYARSREIALDGLDDIMLEVLDASARIVLGELGSGRMQPTVYVHTPKNLLKFQVLGQDVRQSGWKGPMTNGQLQQLMQRVMQGTTLGIPDDIHRTMARTWEEVRELGVKFGEALTGEDFESNHL
ncbi:hypothetical protein V5O48_008070 [Marasmius crinis-equi]|uniref:Uncharacterized protein n=1 Tax=Marasmius crinis-equi TaxID=585013 RepID=A0ABR3FEZ7_9AGAR